MSTSDFMEIEKPEIRETYLALRHPINLINAIRFVGQLISSLTGY